MAVSTGDMNMLDLKPGTKLTSAVCDTQVMVIKGSGEMDLRCGGAQMLAPGEEGSGEVMAEFSGGTQIGGAGDFATPHLRHVLNFIGISDTTIVNARDVTAARAA